MNYLSVEQLSKSFGERILFSEVSFGLEFGQKVGLIAQNGAGKTTLLKMIAGKETAESGKVTLRKGIQVAYLDQNPVFPGRVSVSDALFYGESPMIKAIQSYNDAIETSNMDHMQQAMDQMDALNAWDFEQKIKQVLGKLNITDFDQPVSTLSGGQKRRVALAEIIIHEPDLLLLDEPTNHLDLEMIEWLEEYLSTSKMTLLMVTHDRYFLDRVCNEILSLEGGGVHRYRGSYAYYLEKKEERETNDQVVHGKAKRLYKKELEWIRRQPKARGTKSKARQDNFHELKDQVHQKQERKSFDVDVNMTRLGSKILELHSVSKSFDERTLIQDLSHKFVKGEKVGVIGSNGSGKTTLLNMIMGLEEPSTGTIKQGETVVFGYYTQSGLNFKSGKRVIEVIKDIAENIPLKKGKVYTAAQMLERFLFPRSTHYQLVEKLSGGEQKRLYLLTILMKNPNFLILDEPTNDLDVLAIQVLEEFLADFEGCLMVVTHDRFFMDKLVDHIFAFEGEGLVRDFPGNYSQYRAKREQEMRAPKKEEAAAKPSEPEATRKESKSYDKKLSFNEKREFGLLEKEIAELEREKEKLTNAMNDDDIGHEKLQELGEQMGRIMDEIESKELRWLELSERA